MLWCILHTTYNIRGGRVMIVIQELMWGVGHERYSLYFMSFHRFLKKIQLLGMIKVQTPFSQIPSQLLLCSQQPTQNENGRKTNQNTWYQSFLDLVKSGHLISATANAMPFLDRMKNNPLSSKLGNALIRTIISFLHLLFSMQFDLNDFLSIILNNQVF